MVGSISKEGDLLSVLGDGVCPTALEWGGSSHGRPSGTKHIVVLAGLHLGVWGAETIGIKVLT